MEYQILNMLEFILFFIFLGLTLKVLSKSKIPRMFDKGSLWQIKVIIVFFGISLAYLVSTAIIRLMQISLSF